MDALFARLQPQPLPSHGDEAHQLLFMLSAASKKVGNRPILDATISAAKRYFSAINNDTVMWSNGLLARYSLSTKQHIAGELAGAFPRLDRAFAVALMQDVRTYVWGVPELLRGKLWCFVDNQVERLMVIYLIAILRFRMIEALAIEYNTTHNVDELVLAAKHALHNVCAFRYLVQQEPDIVSYVMPIISDKLFLECFETIAQLYYFRFAVCIKLAGNDEVNIPSDVFMLNHWYYEAAEKAKGIMHYLNNYFNEPVLAMWVWEHTVIDKHLSVGCFICEVPLEQSEKHKRLCTVAPGMEIPVFQEKDDKLWAIRCFLSRIPQIIVKTNRITEDIFFLMRTLMIKKTLLHCVDKFISTDADILHATSIKTSVVLDDPKFTQHYVYYIDSFVEEQSSWIPFAIGSVLLQYH